MKRDKKYRTHFSFAACLSLFALVTFVASCSVVLFTAIFEKFGSSPVTAVLILANIIFLSFICALVDFFRRKLTVEKRVKNILSATREITGGNFDASIKLTHSWGKLDEYDAVAEDINKMAAELKKTEVLKTDFISNVSHEIKTPLSVIQSYAYTLANTGIGEEEKRECAEKIISSVDKIVKLTADVLKLNKLENQVIKPVKMKVNFTGEVEECVMAFDGKICDKNIDVECDLDEVSIYSDSGYIDIIVNNLVSNAVKFTDDGGKIKVVLKKEGENVLFSVSDTGRGMDEETGKRIFEKFYQGDTSHSGEGNGLGLALVKKIIDITGGEISVESALGEGSTFTVKFKEE